MLKNIVISLLAAAVITEKLAVPWQLSVRQQTGAYIGIGVCLIIFLLFFEEIALKWARLRLRIRQIKKKVEALSKLRVEV